MDSTLGGLVHFHSGVTFLHLWVFLSSDPFVFPHHICTPRSAPLFRHALQRSLIYRCPSVADEDTDFRTRVDNELYILFIWFKSDRSWRTRKPRYSGSASRKDVDECEIFEMRPEMSSMPPLWPGHVGLHRCCHLTTWIQSGCVQMDYDLTGWMQKNKEWMRQQQVSSKSPICSKQQEKIKTPIPRIPPPLY